jgi:hypothetical protein
MAELADSLQARVARAERRQRTLAVAFVVFVAAHAILIPLLPTLFEHALQASVGALVLGCVLFVLAATRVRR